MSLFLLLRVGLESIVKCRDLVVKILESQFLIIIADWPLSAKLEFDKSCMRSELGLETLNILTDLCSDGLILSKHVFTNYINTLG